MQLLVWLLAIYFCEHVNSVTLAPYKVCDGCIITSIFYANENQVILTDQGIVYRASANGTNCVQVPELAAIVKIHQYAGRSASFVARKVGYAYFTHDSFAKFTESVLPTYSIGYGLIHVAPYKPGVAYFETYLSMYTTSDSGISWNGPYSGAQFAWSLDRNTANDYFTVTLPQKTGETIFGYSSDYGGTLQTLFYNATSMSVTPNYVWVFNKDGTVLISSKNADPSHTTAESYKFSTFTLSPDFFTLDDAAGEFIAVRDTYNPTTTLFYSDDNGVTWKVSLERVSLSDDAISVEFNKVGKGNYLANIVTAENNVYTKISNDSGLTWYDLNLPRTNATGTSLECTQNCSFYARAKIAGKRSFYASSASDGVIVVIGSLGQSDQSSKTFATFLSVNSGVDWVELVAEETIFEVGKNGTVIVWAPLTPTTVIWYTEDKGATRNTFTISESPVLVYNITTNGTGTNFAVFTKTPATTKVEHVVYSLNIVFTPTPQDWSIGKRAAIAIWVLLGCGGFFGFLYCIISGNPRIKNRLKSLVGRKTENKFDTFEDEKESAPHGGH